MSKIIEQVKCYQTDKRYCPITPPKFLNIDENVFQQSPYSIRYNVEVSLRHHVIIGEKDQVGKIQEKVRAEFAESIFGEFRPLLSNLIEVGLNCPVSETREEIFELHDSLFKKMFEEGVR